MDKYHIMLAGQIGLLVGFVHGSECGEFYSERDIRDELTANLLDAGLTEDIKDFSLLVDQALDGFKRSWMTKEMAAKAKRAG